MKRYFRFNYLLPDGTVASSMWLDMEERSVHNIANTYNYVVRIGVICNIEYKVGE